LICLYLVNQNLRLEKEIAHQSANIQLIYIASFSLEPQMRGNLQVPELQLPPNCNSVRFNLRLEPGPFHRYLATLKNADDQSMLWKSNVIEQRSGAHDLQITVPANLFSAKYYALELSGVTDANASEPVATYAFRFLK